MKILVAAPYYRCGSTLLQRCLHNCEYTMIYGEMNNLFTSIDLLGKMSATQQPNIESKLNNYECVEDRLGEAIARECKPG